MAEEENVTNPLVIYLPVGLDPAERPEWRDSIISDLRAADVVDDGNQERWKQLLDESIREELPDFAAGRLVLMTLGVEPLYVWASLAQPAGDPIRLGEHILDRIVPDGAHADPVDLGQGDIAQGSRIDLRASEDDRQVYTQFSFTARTMTLDGIGDVDVCLTYGTENLDAVERLDLIVTNLIRDPDLAAYLAA